MRCVYCDEELTIHTLTRDHIIPRCWLTEREGGARKDNLVPACQACNSSKSSIESIVIDRFGRKAALSDKAALFIARAMKLNRGAEKAGMYRRMALHVQNLADLWTRTPPLRLAQKDLKLIF